MRGKAAQRKFVFWTAKWYLRVQSEAVCCRREESMETGNRYYQLANRDIVYLKFIQEAHEGLSTMSTVEGKKGIVRINYPICFAKDVDEMMEALSKEIAITEVNEGGEPCSKP